KYGALLEGATTRLQGGEKGSQLASRAPGINGTRIAIVWDEPMPGVGRPWFECPACGQRCRHVYLRDTIACRRCHRLQHAVRHLRRQTPGVGRVERFGSEIGSANQFWKRVSAKSWSEVLIESVTKLRPHSPK